MGSLNQSDLELQCKALTNQTAQGNTRGVDLHGYQMGINGQKGAQSGIANGILSLLNIFDKGCKVLSVSHHVSPYVRPTQLLFDNCWVLRSDPLNEGFSLQS